MVHHVGDMDHSEGMHSSSTVVASSLKVPGVAFVLVINLFVVLAVGLGREYVEYSVESQVLAL